MVKAMLNWKVDENGMIFAEPKGLAFSYLIFEEEKYVLKIVENKEYFADGEVKCFDSLVSVKAYANEHFCKVLDNLLN